MQFDCRPSRSSLPQDLFDSVLDNLVGNALRKRQRQTICGGSAPGASAVCLTVTTAVTLRPISGGASVR